MHHFQGTSFVDLAVLEVFKHRLNRSAKEIHLPDQVKTRIKVELNLCIAWFCLPPKYSEHAEAPIDIASGAIAPPISFTFVCNVKQIRAYQHVTEGYETPLVDARIKLLVEVS